MKKALIATTLSFTLLAGGLSPFGNSAEAKTNDVTNQTVYADKLQFSEKEVEVAKNILNIINELDQNRNLNMYNLSENKQSDIDKLDKDVQEFYSLYKQAYEQANGQLNTADTIEILRSYYYQNINSVQEVQPVEQVTAASVISIKEYKISNQQVTEITKLAGLYGSGWAFMNALAKKFGKSPTFLNMLLVAIPALGVAGLNTCNRYNKGVIITDYRIGATHNFSCSAQK